MAKEASSLIRSSIMKCECKHAYQDSKYGVGNRVHSHKIKGRLANGWRCSVCGANKAER